MRLDRNEYTNEGCLLFVYSCAPLFGAFVDGASQVRRRRTLLNVLRSSQ
jgi:hypothetical protein